MNLGAWDWTIVIGLIVATLAVAQYTKRFNHSVVDFLAANRSAGRYMMAIAGGASGLGAIYIIALFEMHYEAGFVPAWWQMMIAPVIIILSVTGWARYRFRQTRALTLAQFFEMRYSRNFRIFAGTLCWISGILNFGIFPAVAANFFIYYCGIPEHFTIVGINLSTFIFIMLFLLAISLYSTFLGGQITVMVTDFMQGLFVNIAVVVILVVITMTTFKWSHFTEALMTAPDNASLLHPLKTGNVKDFNFWFFMIVIFSTVMNWMGWQGSQAYNSCGKSAHETKMAQILGTWRGLAQALLLMLLPICAYVFMHHHDFAPQAQQVTNVLSTVENPQLQKQITVTVALTKFLPTGLLGLFCAVVLASFISNCNTYLHSWGSIFIQDVIMPLRKTPLSPKAHMLALQLSIAFVAIFIFIFSILFKQNEYIMFFQAITGAIFLGGSGAAIIGGLYWKRGTTAAAWSSLIVGSGLAISAMILRQINESWVPVNSQWVFGISMLLSLIVYIVVSLTKSGFSFNMDKMLHRGIYAIDGTQPTTPILKNRFLEALGITNEFTWRDKLVAWSNIGWSLGWFAVFIIGTVYALLVGTKIESWAEFWKYFIIINFILGVVTTVWFAIGGFQDMRQLFRDLGSARRDQTDDGRVIIPPKQEPMLQSMQDQK